MSDACAPSGPARRVSQRRPGGLVWVALGASLWGADPWLRRPLADTLAASQIVLYEHLILTIVLLPACRRAWTEWRALSPLQWGAVLGVSWGGSALGTICFTEAIRIGNPTTAVLLQKIQPIFAALLARALLGEALGHRFWICLLLALCGAWLVSFGAALPSYSLHAAAALLALAAAGLWGGATVLGRFALRSLSFSSLTALRIILATPLLVALAGARPQWLAARQLFSLVALALVPGLLALLIYYRGLGRTRAALAAVAELSFPATATLLNWTLLGARVSAVQLAGFGLLWGVILNLEKTRKHEC